MSASHAGSAVRSWERVEMDWLLALWETLPRPWPEPVILMFLRYVSGCVARGRRYTVPSRCCFQVRAAAHRGLPIGRRALRDVSGCSERMARVYQQNTALWEDPRRLLNADGADPGCLADDHDEQQIADRSRSRVDPDRASSPRASTIHDPDQKEMGGGEIYVSVPLDVREQDDAPWIDAPPPDAQPSTYDASPPGDPMPKQTTLLPTEEPHTTEDTLDLPTLLDGDATLLAPLRLAGIHTVAALTALTGAEVRNRKGMGPKRVLLVHEALLARGLDFAPEPTKAKKTAKGEYPGMKNLTDRWCAFFERATGQQYMWTSGGQTSDNKAAQAIYVAVGWSADPSPEVQQAVGDMVRRYVKHCTAGHTKRVPTLYDLARNLSQFRQADALVEATRSHGRHDDPEEKGRRTMAGIHELLNLYPKRDTDADA